MPRRKTKIMPSRRTKKKIQYVSKEPKRPSRSSASSAFKTPGGEITEIDLLRLADKTGFSYLEIRRIYEAMKNDKGGKAS